MTIADALRQGAQGRSRQSPAKLDGLSTLPEIGVRMAFGARRGQVLALILRQGLTQTALGLVIGLGLATLLGRLLQVALYDVKPTDPLAFAVPTLALTAVAIAACAIPARRAAALDPVKALHHS